MKNAALTSLCLALLGATAVPLQAQENDIKVAEIEAVRRQALKEDMKRKLDDAIVAEKRGAFLEAAQLYTDCLDLIKKIGTGVDAEHRAVLAGFIRTRVQLAEQAQRAGDYAAADDQYRRILREDPKNDAVQRLWKKNEELRLANLGKMPDEATLAKGPAIFTNNVQASTYVQNGKFLYEAGRLDEAEAALRQAIKLDPNNPNASFYLRLVQEQRNKNLTARRIEANNERIVEVQRAWTEPVKRELPIPNMYARTNLVNTSKGRQRIYQKLDTIRMNEVSWDSLPLGQVIESLNKDARNRDPDKKGINFIINSSVDPVAAPPAAVDPATGLPIAAPAAAADDITATTIKLVPALSDLTLHQVLDAIVKVADRPIKYSVEDYAVVFSLRAAETPPLHVRWFKVDPNTFMQGLQGVTALDFGVGSQGTGGGGGGRGGGGRGGGGRGGGGGGFGGGGQGGQGQGQGGGNGAEYIGVTLAPGSARGGRQGQQQQQPQQRQPGQPGQLTLGTGPGVDHLTVATFEDQLATLARQFFITAGVDLALPKSVFFNDRSGMLMVRATLQDLDTIEQAIEVLNMAPPQVTIEAKIIEITQEDIKALGFDWFLGNTLISKGRVGLQGGSAPSLGAPDPITGVSPAASRANPNGVFPGPSLINAIPPSATDNLITSGLRNGVNAPAIATVTGILTDPQFRVVIKALEQRMGVDVITAPKVTTMSARQAQIKVVEVRYIVTDLDLGGTGATVGAGVGVGNVVQNQGAAIQPLPEPFELGPVLDVVPYVSADGYTIQMTIIPTIKEFVGYDLESARLFSPQVQTSAGGNPLTTTTPLPIFRLRQVVTSAIVWDGQTIVLGGLLSEDSMKIKDKVPVLGDLPLVGRLFRSESSSTRKKNLVIFVTPTIIDPAGNRVHSEEELPFVQTSIPQQRTTNP
jgi:type II secretory pathway component GspD/PulD (secretin)/tetratricopeptide (TPR) repeat protein